MTRIHLVIADSLITITGEQERWVLQEKQIVDGELVCVEIDPFVQERVYCGTAEHGLWRSNDAGETWEKVGKGITHAAISAIAVSGTEHVGGYGVVWAGTEPSALFRSEDGGETWIERTTLQDIPSKASWSYPSRPYTHHVRWIQLDPHNENNLFVAIEQGGVMRSMDKGLSWQDHNPEAQHDGHVLRMHKQAPQRLYEAAGGDKARFMPRFRLTLPPFQPRLIMQEGGYAESQDSGTHWQTCTEGLEKYHYLWGLAIDPGDPDTIVASAATGPIQAHDPEFCSSYIIRRSKGQAWQRVTAGIPKADGSTCAILATNDKETGVFYAANNHGVFRSSDQGQTWQRLPVEWSAALGRRPQVQSMVIA